MTTYGTWGERLVALTDHQSHSTAVKGGYAPRNDLQTEMSVFGRLQEILDKSADDQARARRRFTIRSVFAQDFELLLT
jgi:hypothetical protein